MSDRLKSLVVYALQGRYDVAGGRHPGQGPRDRAVPRGRARGLRRRGRVRRRRHRQRGRQRPRRLPHPADLPARRRHQRLLPHARHPHRRRRRHRAPARARRRLARAPRSTSAGSTTGASRSRAGMGLDASVVERVDRNPRLKARFGPVVLRPVRGRARSSRATSCARRGSRSRSTAQTLRGVSAFVQNGDAYTYFQTPPDPARRGRAARLGRPRRRRAHARERRSTSRPCIVPRAVQARRDRASTAGSSAFGGVARGASCARVDGRPVPGPGRRRPHRATHESSAGFSRPSRRRAARRGWR